MASATWLLPLRSMHSSRATPQALGLSASGPVSASKDLMKPSGSDCTTAVLPSQTCVDS